MIPMIFMEDMVVNVVENEGYNTTVNRDRYSGDSWIGCCNGYSSSRLGDEYSELDDSTKLTDTHGQIYYKGKK